MTHQGIAEGPSSVAQPTAVRAVPTLFFVPSDARDVHASSRLAVHLLAQSPRDVRASIPVSDATTTCLLMARAYDVEGRLDVRDGDQAGAFPAGASLVDADQTTPASILARFATAASSSPEIRPVGEALAGRRVALVTNIPIHYRLALFNLIADRLEQAGASLHVLFTASLPADRSWIVAGDMRFDHAYLDSLDLRGGTGRQMYPRGLSQHLDRIRPEVVLSGGFSPFVSGRVARWCRKNCVPFGVWSGEIASRPTARSRARRRQRRTLLGHTDFAVAYGWESARYLDSVGGTSLPVVIGRNTSTLPPEGSNDASIPVELLAVSRAEAGKALDLIVAAVCRLENSSVRLTIVGDGPELPRLRELAAGSDRIRFLGALPHERVLEEYGLAHGFLFPSSYDVFGLVLVEAMAAGLPVITSSAPGALADLAVDDWNSLVVKEATVDAWCGAIRRIAEDPALRRRLGTAAARTVRERWTIEHSADALLAAFRLGLLVGARRTAS